MRSFSPVYHVTLKRPIRFSNSGLHQDELFSYTPCRRTESTIQNGAATNGQAKSMRLSWQGHGCHDRPVTHPESGSLAATDVGFADSGRDSNPDAGVTEGPPALEPSEATSQTPEDTSSSSDIRPEGFESQPHQPTSVEDDMNGENRVSTDVSLQNGLATQHSTARDIEEEPAHAATASTSQHQDGYEHFNQQ